MDEAATDHRPTAGHERFNFVDANALRAKIRDLGLSIPLDDDVSILLEPVEVSGRQAENRLAIQPMEGRDADVSGSPTDLTERRYQRFAAGGSGLIWFEATAVVPEGRAAQSQLWINRENVGEYRRLVERTRQAAAERFGNEHNLLLVLQLTHSGRYSRPEGEPRPIFAHHSEVLDSLATVKDKQYLISDDDLNRLQDSYVAAGRLARDAGFDGVDVKACHGYLVSELLASFTRTNSRYGGSFDNRSRFLMEVVSRLRDEIPDVLITSRINAFDGMPHPWGFGADDSDPPRPRLDEPEELARRLRDAGCGILNVSVGNPYYQPHCGRPYDKPVRGSRRPAEHPLVGVDRLISIAAELQHAVPEIPIVGTGYSWLRHLFPFAGAGALRTGGAGLIGLGRTGFAYPDFPIDLKEHGKLDPKKCCIACSSCSQIMRNGGRVGCIVRDGEIYIEEYKIGRLKSKGARTGG